MKVLSLFDGMACGMIAMQLAGVDVESYDAYEIDKYAIKTAQHNFPMIKEHGDVFNADFTQYEGVDFLIGGSPCTYWSIAQTKNRETVASGIGWELFSQYVLALHEAKPKYFIYENNKSMSKQIRASIDEAFGFEAVLINSALVSAQNRQRLYWVGKRNEDGTYSKVNVEQPAARGILLKDVLDSAVAEPARIPNYSTEKSRPLSASYANKGDGEGSLKCEAFPDNPNKQVFDFVAETVACRCSGRVDTSGNGYAKYECREDGKSNTLDTNTTNGAMVAEPINVTENGKSQTLKAQYCKNSVANFCCYSSTYGASGVAEPINVTADGKAVAQTAQSGGFGPNTGLYAVPISAGNNKIILKAIDSLVDRKGFVPRMFNPYNRAEIAGKAPTLSTGSMVTSSCAVLIFETAEGKQIPAYEVHCGYITIKGKQYPIKLKDGFYIIRKLTVRECMRLQTVPEWYEFPVSDSQAYKMLGNGWTCEVIAHILKSLKEA